MSNHTKISRVSRVTRAAGLSAVLALGLAACTGGGGTKNSSGDDGGTLVIGLEAEAGINDPQVAGGWISWRVNRQMFETLVTEDLTVPSGQAQVPEIIPGLAKSWEVSPDGLTYTFKIREGVKFHDGTPLDAAAVEYNFRRMWDKNSPQYSAQAAGQTAYIWTSVADMKATDDMTFVVTMKTPFQPFLRLLTQGGNGSTGIISPTALKQYGNEAIADHPSGTGPFKFEERVRGERISVVRNDDYWGEKPALKHVVFRPVPDAAARTAALRSGDIDIVSSPSPDSVQGLVDDGYQLSEGAMPHIWYLQFNMKDEHTSNKLVRQAVNLAINREGMAKDLLKGTANPAYDVQGPANDAYVKREEAFRYDPAEAKKLLAEAGYPNGFETTLTTSTDGSGQIIPVPMAEYIQQNLADIGIKVNIKSQEWNAYLSTWAQGMAQGTALSQISYGMTTPYWLRIVTSTERMAPNGPNVGYYSNPELDSVMQKAVQSTSDEQAVGFWKEANSMVIEDAAIAPVVSDKAPYILGKNVKGFVSPSEEWFDLTKVTLDK